MTSRTHTPEDVQKIMEPWSPVSIGVDVTEEGAHVVGIYAMSDDTSQIFYSKYYPVPQRKPLTDEEITDAVREAGFDWHYGWTLDDEEPNRFTKFARAIEAAHGIKGLV